MGGKAGELEAELTRFLETSPDSQSALPSTLYVSDAAFALEKQSIFSKEWICVGRAEEFQTPGGYRAITIGEVPVLVVAQLDGPILAMSNVCRHRGTVIAQGDGHARQLVCPYHAWVYGLDGRLRNAPFITDSQRLNVTADEHFERDKFSLPRYRVECWGGFVYVNLDADAAPLGPRVAGLSEHFAAYNLAEMRQVLSFTLEWRCNWKLAIENFCESYHVFKVHPKTVEPAWPTRTMDILPSGEGYNLHRRTPAPDADSIRLKNSYFKSLRNVDKGEYVNLACLFPAHAMSIKEGMVAWICPRPVDVDCTRVQVGCAMLDEDGQAHTEEAIAAIERRLTTFIGEDQAIVESVQRGLRSGALPNAHCTAWERPNRDFQRYLAHRILGTG
jgi:choline monooxygenase